VGQALAAVCNAFDYFLVALFYRSFVACLRKEVKANITPPVA
jgi:hypothetical protein